MDSGLFAEARLCIVVIIWVCHREIGLSVELEIISKLWSHPPLPGRGYQSVEI